MNLTGLLACLSDDPGFVDVRDLAPSRLGVDRRGDVGAAPAGGRADRRRATIAPPGHRRHRHRARGRGRGCRAFPDLVPSAEVAVFPSWETLPHERLSPSSDTVGRRVAVMHRLAHPDAADPLTRPIDVLVTSVRAFLQPVVTAIADVPPVRLRVGDEVDLDDLVEPLRRPRLRAQRPDRATRPGRRARRHPRRLPADRGAPAPGGVLGRHGRGDPDLLRRRPAFPRAGRARPVGAGGARAAADPAGARARRRRFAQSAAAPGRDVRQAGPGDPCRGHGVARPGPGGRHDDPARARRRTGPRRAPRARAHPAPRPRRRAHRPGVPDGVVAQRHRRATRRPSTSPRPATASSTTCGAIARARARRLVAADAAVAPTPSSRTSGTASSAIPGHELESYRGDSERAIADLRAWASAGCPGRAARRGPRIGRAAWSRSSRTPASPVVETPDLADDARARAASR